MSTVKEILLPYLQRGVCSLIYLRSEVPVLRYSGLHHCCIFIPEMGQCVSIFRDFSQVPASHIMSTSGPGVCELLFLAPFLRR